MAIASLVQTTPVFSTLCQKIFGDHCDQFIIRVFTIIGISIAVGVIAKRYR